MDLGWDLIDWTVLDVQFLLADKSDIFGHILCYIHFHSSSPIGLFQILVHLVTSKMHGEYGVVDFIHQLLFQFLDIQYTIYYCTINSHNLLYNS